MLADEEHEIIFWCLLSPSLEIGGRGFLSRNTDCVFVAEELSLDFRIQIRSASFVRILMTRVSSKWNTHVRDKVESR